jgi:preprotein translocase subunit YajC
MTTWLMMLANDAQPAGGGDGGFLQLLYLFGPMIVVFLLINHLLITRPQRREQERHQKMLGTLKKNDRVLTAGGIIGTFVSMSEDKKEITLRVDENTRIKFRSEYVRGVLDEGSGEGGEGSKGS